MPSYQRTQKLESCILGFDCIWRKLRTNADGVIVALFRKKIVTHSNAEFIIGTSELDPRLTIVSMTIVKCLVTGSIKET